MNAKIVDVAADEGHFQGELYIGPVIGDGTDEDLGTEAAAENGEIIVGHSETGHHHVIAAAEARLIESGDPLLAYLDVRGAAASLVHKRSHDTHPTLRLKGKGVRKVVRQREVSPTDGKWGKAAD
jgi:hypothetical protein